MTASVSSAISPCRGGKVAPSPHPGRNRMKIRAGLIAAVAACAVFAGGAFGASLDSLVIHGDAAKKILEKYAISSDTAKKIAAACIAYAKGKNVAVSIAIMD